MKRLSIVFLTACSLSLITLMLLTVSMKATAAAPPSTPDMFEFNPQIGIVADTTASMNPELQALNAAWDAHLAENWPEYVRHDLVAFKDTPFYRGATDDPAVLGGWLDELTASGGGGCPDGDFLGLLALARNTSPQRLPRNRALLLSDSAPLGDRRHLAFVVDKMLAHGISISTLRTGWCDTARLPHFAYQYLAIATGGMHFEPDGGTPNLPDTLIALNTMATPDLLQSRVGFFEPGQELIIPFEVDGSISILNATEPDEHWWCLTCLLPIPAPEMFKFKEEQPQMTFEFFDPDGNVVPPGTPGYTVLAGSNIRLHTLRSNIELAGGPIFPGGWEVHISGEGEYMIDIYAESSIHLAYLGRHMMPRNSTALVRAVLVDSREQSPPNNVSFSLVSLHGDVSHPIMLFDDGNHRDGEAGDGIWGGEVETPAEPGLWRLAAEGTVTDGTTFRRLDPAPIRVGRFRMADPEGRLALPDSIRTQTFSLMGDASTEESDPTTFELALFSSLGWTPTDTVPFSVTLQPGERFDFTVVTTIPAGASPGDVEEVSLAAIPAGNPVAGLTASSLTMIVDRLPVYLPVMLRPD